MSTDFWAGYISGGIAILIGNPMDRTKVRLQAHSSSLPLPVEPTLSSRRQPSPTPHLLPLHSTARPAPALASLPSLSSLPALLNAYLQSKSPLVAGTAAPVLGYGALNALLFMAYNRTEDALNRALSNPVSPDCRASSYNAVNNTRGSNLLTTWLAGAAGGIATWAISTPTELIKCRAQLASILGTRPIPSTPSPPSSASFSPESSYRIAQTILRTEGLRGLYHGGVVTVLRDAIGYGFYFWAYELGGRMMDFLLGQQQQIGRAPSYLDRDDVHKHDDNRRAGSIRILTQETAKVLLCGGVAGVVTWASVFPLDVIKTRVQGQIYSAPTLGLDAKPLLGTRCMPKRKGAIQIAKEAYREGGTRTFFRGLMVCSKRAFLVNAVQWLCYEWAMLKLGRRDGSGQEEPDL